MKAFYLITGLLLVSSAHANERYYGNHWTSCEVSQGRYHAKLCADGGFSGSGNALVRFRDRSGEPIGSTTTTWNANVNSGCAAIADSEAPKDAIFCFFTLLN